jgi:hypothetical protein
MVGRGGGECLNKKFEEHGRMFSRGKVVKLRFPVPNNDLLSFFMFKEDIEKLLDEKLFYARIFLDEGEKK